MARLSNDLNVKMANIKKAFESLGFKHVQRYLQSGNVIFDCEPMETANIAERVE